jgi:hypothetical protein
MNKKYLFLFAINSVLIYLLLNSFILPVIEFIPEMGAKEALGLFASVPITYFLFFVEVGFGISIFKKIKPKNEDGFISTVKLFNGLAIVLCFILFFVFSFTVQSKEGFVVLAKASIGISTCLAILLSLVVGLIEEFDLVPEQ